MTTFDLFAPEHELARRRPAPRLWSPYSWAEFLFAVVNLVPAIFFFVTITVFLTVGLSLVVLYVGLPLMLIGLAFARAGGAVYRSMSMILLDHRVSAPAPIDVAGLKPMRAGRVLLTDPGCWRAVTFHVINMLIAPIQFGLALGVYAYGLGAVFYSLWQPYLPQERASDGSLHRGAQLLPGYFIDTWPRMTVLAIAGVGVLLLGPHIVRFFATIQRAMISAFLGR